MEMMLLKWISKLEYYKLPQHCGLRDRRQFVCFLFTTFAEMLFIPANLMGLNDYLQPHAFDALNWGQLVFVILLQVAYWRNWLSVRTGLYVFFVEIAAKISTESLYQVFMGGANSYVGKFQHHPDIGSGSSGCENQAACHHPRVAAYLRPDYLLLAL